MKIKIILKDFSGSTFRFYIEDKYRNFLFGKLKTRYRDWRDVAKILNLNVRNLFGIRRGWEIRGNKKLIFPILAKNIINIAKITKINLNDIEKHITYIKHGQSGKINKIKLPLILKDNDLRINSIYSSVFDYKYINLYFKKLNRNCLKIRPNREFIISPQITTDYLEKLRIRGLCPLLLKNRLTYRVPGTNNIKEIYLPKRIIFDENFAKQFGKWMGDRCGGKRKIGVANKDYSFIKEFEEFIKNKLEQKDYELYLTCNKKFKLDNKLKKLVKKIKISNTQYGDYAFRIETSNALLRREVFDFVENNLRDILLSLSKEIRYAYYAGLIEAEGSINADRTITIAFGINLEKSRKYNEVQNTLNKAIELCFLLKRDGFNPRISRKLSNTTKTKILKYDVNLLLSHKTRLKEVKFIKETIGQFITHNEKLKKLIELEGILRKEKNKSESTQPELNIGLVGH